MNCESYTLKSNNLTQLHGFLKKELQLEYENYEKIEEEYFILGFEDFYFRNNSTQFELIYAKIENQEIKIDIVGSAGGSGLLNLNLGSEKSFINKFMKIIEKYEKEYHLSS